MRMQIKRTPFYALVAVSAVSLLGILTTNANIVDEPLINECVTDAHE